MCRSCQDRKKNKQLIRTAICRSNDCLCSIRIWCWSFHFVFKTFHTIIVLCWIYSQWSVDGQTIARWFAENDKTSTWPSNIISTFYAKMTHWRCSSKYQMVRVEWCYVLCVCVYVCVCVIIFSVCSACGLRKWLLWCVIWSNCCYYGRKWNRCSKH